MMNYLINVVLDFYVIGGVMFKIYIVGETIKVVRRKSLPNVDKNDPHNKGVMQFPRVSCASASADEANLEPGVAGS
jgi:inositol-1,3,4-trisphosphate 5/6-kinase / inositol-tetrakisphosphate 1-kinase